MNGITVTELIDYLKMLVSARPERGDAIVYVSRDSEELPLHKEDIYPDVTQVMDAQEGEVFGLDGEEEEAPGNFLRIGTWE